MFDGYFDAIKLADRRVWRDTLIEVVIIVILSAIPLLAAFLLPLLPKQGTTTAPAAFGDAFLQGQLLFYSISIIASIAAVVNKDLKDFYPLRTILNLFCFLGIALCCLIIGQDPKLNATDDAILKFVSLGMFVLSLALYVLAMLCERVEPNLKESLADQDNNFKEQLRKSREI